MRRGRGLFGWTVIGLGTPCWLALVIIVGRRLRGRLLAASLSGGDIIFGSRLARTILAPCNRTIVSFVEFSDWRDPVGMLVVVQDIER